MQPPHGIIPAMVLAELEERSGRRVPELFDLVAGTSTGGILALGLTCPDPAEPTRARYRSNLYRSSRAATPGRHLSVRWNTRSRPGPAT